jgi:uncharacterized membrane protein
MEPAYLASLYDSHYSIFEVTEPVPVAVGGTVMCELIAIGFKDEFQAVQVMSDLRQRKGDWTAALDDAVVLSWHEDGKLRVQQNIDPTTLESVGWSVLWGSLISAALLLPTMSGLSIAAAAAWDGARTLPNGALEPTIGVPNARWWRDVACLSDDFLRDLGAMVQPGSSAIFALLRGSNLRPVVNELRGYGGTLLRTPLNWMQDGRIRAVLALGGLL